MSKHTVHAFDEELRLLRARIAAMGGLAETLVSRSIDALLKRDLEEAADVIQLDHKLDAMELEIEEQAILTIALRQPVADDLRTIIVAIRIANDLERIGDLAKNIAKRASAINSGIPRSLGPGLRRMGDLAMAQLNNVLDAYAASDAVRAVDVWRQDEELDALHTSIFRELLTYMMEDPRVISSCTHLLFAAKNIERIGDHATNIAENIYFLVHGTPLRDARPKGDASSSTSLDPEI